MHVVYFLMNLHKCFYHVHRRFNTAHHCHEVEVNVSSHTLENGGDVVNQLREVGSLVNALLPAVQQDGEATRHDGERYYCSVATDTIVPVTLNVHTLTHSHPPYTHTSAYIHLHLFRTSCIGWLFQSISLF